MLREQQSLAYFSCEQLFRPSPARYSPNFSSVSGPTPEGSFFVGLPAAAVAAGRWRFEVEVKRPLRMAHLDKDEGRETEQYKKFFHKHDVLLLFIKTNMVSSLNTYMEERMTRTNNNPNR